MTRHGLIFAVVMLAACATTGDGDGQRQPSAIADFIEVSELTEIGFIRTMDQLSSREVDEWYVIVSARNQDYLLEYFTRCTQRLNRRVEPDFRSDPRALHAGADTYRGCRIKAIYPLEPGQAAEILEIGEAVGG